MPTDKDFKRLVRQRTAATGETYTAARAALASEPRGPRRPEASATRRRQERWIELLADPEQAEGAFALLKALAEDELRPLLVAGSRHASWRVRRRCCRLLDDLTLVPETIAALTERLDDDHPKVRRAAMHALACEHCKPDGCALDVRPLFLRMIEDPNAGVRSTVVGPLTWRNDAQWATVLLERVAASDPSAELRALAQQGLDRHQLQADSDAARRALPDELRRTTERHRGKWVAVADGRIIGVAVFEGGLRRVIKGTAHGGEAAVYWVAPEGERD